MNWRLQLSPEAQEDLLEIQGYRRKKEGIARARKVRQTITAALRDLLTDPYRWPSIEREDGFRIYKRTVNSTYNIYYEVNDDVVFILTIWHAKRNPRTF